MTAASSLVSMGDVQATRSDTDFSCIGVGSGMVVIAFEPTSKVAACGHFVLPRAPVDYESSRPGKYIDTGIAWMLKAMLDLGAEPRNVRAALVGGASLKLKDHDGPPPYDLGVRNIEAAYRTLEEFNVSCRAQEIGGSAGRNVTLLGRDGTVRVRSWPEPEHVLCSLRG
jgi:chemotaxis protein CheD